MKPAPFRYERPATLEAVLALLDAHGAQAEILAGGQSLMPMLALRVARPDLVIDINRIAGLGDITAIPDGGVRIGARARHAEVMASPLVPALMRSALAHVAHPAIRNRGTLGGSLALADPAAEMPCCMVALGARIVTLSSRGETHHDAASFFHGLYSTARRPDEMILRIEIPPLGPQWRFAFLEEARRLGDYAIAGVALAIGAGEVRLAFCGVEPAPRCLPATEALILAGADPLPGLVELAPMDSDDAPEAYRRHLAGVLLKRALREVGHG